MHISLVRPYLQQINVNMYFLKGPSNFKFMRIHYSKLCHLLFNGQSNSHHLLHINVGENVLN